MRSSLHTILNEVNLETELVFLSIAPFDILIAGAYTQIRMYASRALRMPILKRSSYYDADYRQSPALIRARRPYLIKNAITGIAIMGFAFGVCTSHTVTVPPKLSNQVQLLLL